MRTRDYSHCRCRCFKRLDDCATLKSRCLRKVVLLIMTARKPPDDFACPPELNPFISFPSDLVEDLIETVIQMSPRARDKITPDVRADDLSLLVRSGRVRCFSLWDVEMHSRDFSAALRQLGDTGAAAALRELEIDGVYVRGRRPESILRSLDNVGRLLRAAPKLRALRLGLSGRSLLDLAALENLEELSVTYDCHRELDDIIGQAEKTGDPLWPRLRCFSYGDYFSSASRRTVSYLLCHCTQLVELRADVSGALLELHEQQFLQEGGLVCRYRLQKTTFGSFVYGSDQQKRPPQRDLDICGPSPLCVQIATVACPNLVDVDVYVDCHESVLALAEFSHLRYLKLMWVSSKLAGCFETSTLSLLHEVGCQLVELCLHSFVKVDLNAVAFLCPSLEAFGLIQCRTVANHVPVSQPFAALTKVRVIPPPDYPAIQAEDDLCCVLGSCSALKSFVVDLVADDFELLVDRLLQSTNSSFRSVELAGLYFQQPTTTPAVRDGVLRLLLACEALRYLVVADTELGDLAKQVNPRLKIRFEYLYVGL
ncbi:uncharacterized protein LOC142786879 isoform X1 [Rhipicephalus microplus]|uniref:uncharacterized protein LOC142786879 isoform X1 n=1 Tax=Rhipicephalus microplus TaxID=6941 RepID=UPI003F6AD33F